MRTFRLGLFGRLGLSFGSLAWLSCSALSCSSKDEGSTPVGDADVGATDTGPTAPVYCSTPSDAVRAVRFVPKQVIVAPGESRTVRLFIEPDVCEPTKVPMELGDVTKAKIEGSLTADWSTAETLIKVTGVAAGTTTATAKFGVSTATLEVIVQSKDAIVCAGAQKGTVGPGKSLEAPSGARLTIAEAASRDDSAKVEPFEGTLECGTDATPAGRVALGPAITFGPGERRWLREIVFELPINPARMPPNAKLKHVEVYYSSKSLSPRVIPVANPAIEKNAAGKWVFRFEAPRLGTYQVVVREDAGTKKRKRTMKNRAVFGFSMGGIGASLFGMNHHDLFDMVSPLGGPMDSTWFLWYNQKYHFGGACERKAGDPLPTTPCKADVGKPTELFMHVQDYEHWWHVNGVEGTGGNFARNDYTNILRDVSSMWGNPASENAKFPHVAAGIDPPTSMGSANADYCGDPVKATIAKTGYFDRRFNPDGKLPVIRVCDGASAPENVGIWAPGGRQPLEMVTAVDYNGNGKRDEGEPIITQPYEPFSDFGVDGKASKDEPGYDAVLRPDPAGDDYDPQYNPLGTEENHVFDKGEAFEDVGLDGVKCPAPGACPFDTGEGDGKFTMTRGLQTFYDRDARAQMGGWGKPPASGDWTDKALDDLDFYSDGGIRDLFNWGVVANHYIGGFVGKKRPVMYFNDWTHFPNARITENDRFDPKDVDFEAMPKAVQLRYGNLDSTPRLIAKGDGQHVGYVDQVFRRIQTSLFYMGQRWPTADRSYIENPPDVDSPTPCGGSLTCSFPFTAADGRTGPTTVILPPGYHHPDAKGLRYPVVYFLHGYGQTPEDLKALVLLVQPFMGNALSSKATRLQKMIMVFVDGRCRGEGASAECIKGTFYTNSVRPGGPQMDTFMLDLMKHVDKSYRVAPPSEVEETD